MDLKAAIETVKRISEEEASKFAGRDDSWLPVAYLFDADRILERVTLTWDDGHDYRVLKDETVPGQIETLRAETVVFRFLILDGSSREKMIVLAANHETQQAQSGEVIRKTVRSLGSWKPFEDAASQWVPPARAALKRVL